MKKILLLILIITVLSLLLIATGISQPVNNAKSLGLAGSYLTQATGPEAVLWNPANLAFDRESGLSLNLFSAGLSLNNNSFSLGNVLTYRDNFSDKENKATILSLIPPEGLTAAGYASASILGLSIGNWAINSSVQGASNIKMSKELFELLVYDYTRKDTVILSGAEGEAWTVAEFGLSYGFKLWENNSSFTDQELMLGISGKILKGLFYEKITRLEGTVITDENAWDSNVDLQVRSARGGYGYSFDVGAALQLNRNLKFGLSFLNLINAINWSKITEETDIVFKADTQAIQQALLTGDTVLTRQDFVRSIENFQTRIPTLILAGFSYSMARTTFSFTWEQGFKEVAGSSPSPRLSLGSQFDWFNFLVLRGGIGISGNEKTTYALGLGFNFSIIELDLAVSETGALLPLKSKGMGVAVSSGLKF